MRKEITVCDECGKILEREEIKGFNFEFYFFDLCDECYKKKNGLKEEFETLNKDYDKKRKELYKKYSIDKILNM